jgi:DNA-binding transcriptional MerR regulator
MTRTPSAPGDDAWKQFVLQHGQRARASDLAYLLGQTERAVIRLRGTGACARLPTAHGFAALFALWNGRDPEDAEWPPPRRAGGDGYEWQPPELALLASLVGRLGKPAIAQALTERLRAVTGDPAAERTQTAVQVAMGKIGLQTSDVVGGITTIEAGRKIGSFSMVHQAISRGDIRPVRVGRRYMIPHDAWSAWKASRCLPPDGYIPLATLKKPLAIKSDKLSEFARLGYVPTAIRCNPFGPGRSSTRFGTWYVAPDVAERLIADRRDGRPMPWHGKPLTDNLRVTFTLWQDRRHPASCETCRGIWGKAGAPTTFDAYLERYPPLTRGAKRHLTRVWAGGLGVADLARIADRSPAHIRRALRNGAIDPSCDLDQAHVTRTNASRWISRGCPTGDAQQSWLSVETAARRYLFTPQEMKAYIACGRLASRTGTEGAARGVVYVLRQQCARLREEFGFTETEAARRAGVSVSHLRELLRDLNWRGQEGIPLATVQAVIRRTQSRPGHTLDQAAAALGRTRAWIEARIKDGTVRPLRRAWDGDRLYLSEPMMARLRAWKNAQAKDGAHRAGPTGDRLRVGQAALEAGVSVATLIKWAERGDVARVRGPAGWLYPREGLRRKASAYWAAVRFRRATPPAWLGGDSANP